jgi:hypothetical protein
MVLLGIGIATSSVVDRDLFNTGSSILAQFGSASGYTKSLNPDLMRIRIHNRPFVIKSRKKHTGTGLVIFFIFLPLDLDPGFGFRIRIHP